jgi:hypothetical protein
MQGTAQVIDKNLFDASDGGLGLVQIQLGTVGFGNVGFAHSQKSFRSVDASYNISLYLNSYIFVNPQGRKDEKIRELFGFYREKTLFCPPKFP